MRAVVMRVTSAAVSVDGATVAAIGRGLLVLLGVAVDDGPEDARWMARKIGLLRVFEDEAGKMNRAIADVGGEVLIVSQFTLLGDAREGNRPSFHRAAGRAEALSLYEYTAELLAAQGLTVVRGRFGAHMAVSSVNDGPVTILLDSRGTF